MRNQLAAAERKAKKAAAAAEAGPSGEPAGCPKKAAAGRKKNAAAKTSVDVDGEAKSSAAAAQAPSGDVATADAAADGASVWLSTRGVSARWYSYPTALHACQLAFVAVGMLLFILQDVSVSGAAASDRYQHLHWQHGDNFLQQVVAPLTVR